jgi:hypothetical protein
LCREEHQETDIDPNIVQELKNMLDKCNPLVKKFRHAHDLLEENNRIDISIRIIGAQKRDPTQYEMPNTEDLAMLIVGDLNLEKTREILLLVLKTMASNV